MTTCEFFVTYSADPAQRQMCGALAIHTFTLATPLRHNLGDVKQHLHLCQKHYESSSKTLVTA